MIAGPTGRWAHNLIAVLVFVLGGLALLAQATPALGASVLAVPPPGGITQGIAGTDDPAELAAAQLFEVQAVWFMEGQQWRVYVPGAPRSSGSLSADSVVTIRRVGTPASAVGAAPQAPTGVSPIGSGNALPTPPVGGVVSGLAGTNDPATLVAQQPFSVASVFMLDVPTQRWLVYVPSAPALVSSLRTGLLQPDSVVTIRRAATPDPAPTPTPTLAGSQTPSDVTPEELQMVALVNEERTSRGLSALEIDMEMVLVARAHSADMRDRDYFAHTNPDGLDPFDRMSAAGISYGTAGENLAYADSVSRAHTLLMESPGHRANILNGDFGRVGIGIVEIPSGWMITQVFAD